MVGPPFKSGRLGIGTDRRRRVPGYGSDKFGVRGPWTCGLRWLSARHQLANCRRNALSLSHGATPWLGLGPVASANLPSACNFRIRKMARVKNNFRATKKRGRPATGMAPVLPVRAPEELIARIELWAQKQPDKPSRSEAVRRLIELGLDVKNKRQ